MGFYQNNIFTDMDDVRDDVQSGKYGPRKTAALKTLLKCVDIYDEDNSDILIAGFYIDFMQMIHDQIMQVVKTISDEY